MTVGLAVAGLLLAMLALRMPIAVAMFVPGALGYAWIAGIDPLQAHLKHMAWGRFSVYDLSVIPLFLLMGQFATRGGLSRALFEAGAAFVGHWRGGLAVASVGACAAFGSVSGSSLATAATMARVALPELERHRYHPGFAGAVLASGGTLGMLIPPSVPLVVYAMLAEQNVATVFIAAIVPGVLAAVGYAAVVAVLARLRPDLTGPGIARRSGRERWQAAIAVWPVLLIFIIVAGGIYGGVFTPTEAASVGVVATAVLSRVAGDLDLRGVRDALVETASGTAMLFLILLGADMLNAFFAVSGLPAALVESVAAMALPPLVLMTGLVLFYVLLGAVLDSLSMILLTMPLVLPLVLGMEYAGLGADEKALWFGMIALVVMEMGLISPPVGLNVSIIQSVAGANGREADLQSSVFRWVLPFLGWDLLRVVLLVLFPVLSLGLVRWLGN